MLYYVILYHIITYYYYHMLSIVLIHIITSLSTPEKSQSLAAGSSLCTGGSTNKSLCRTRLPPLSAWQPTPRTHEFANSTTKKNNEFSACALDVHFVGHTQFVLQCSASFSSEKVQQVWTILNHFQQVTTSNRSIVCNSRISWIFMVCRSFPHGSSDILLGPSIHGSLIGTSSGPITSKTWGTQSQAIGTIASGE